MEKEINQMELIKKNSEDTEINAAKACNSSNDELNSKKKSKKRERSPIVQTQVETRCQSNLMSDKNSNLQINVNNSTLNTNNLPVKKEKQKPESWNKIEQQIFFNALRQNGKNFESITQCFNARQKKYKINDGAGIQRSKEQIRHFYYRTWHKIIRYISLPVANQENQNLCETQNDITNYPNGKIVIGASNCSVRDMQVKCLIAYNALMNKSYRWNKKTAIKLVELINHGWTTVREKGKITRLRMPICKVTGKTQNDIEQTGQSNSVPNVLSIFLEPNTESAYCRVHKLAQNPFLNIDLNSSQTIKFLIEFVENKWKNRQKQFIEKFRIENQLKYSKSSSQEINSMTDSDDNDSQNKPKYKNFLNDINQKIHYLENLVIYPQDFDSTFESIIEPSPKSSQSSENKMLRQQIQISSQIINDNPMVIDECAVDQENFMASKKTLSKSDKEVNKKSDLELNGDQIRSGFTSKNCFLNVNGKDKKEITFSQLYLALNRPSTLKFKYDWIIEKEELEQIQSASSSSHATLPSMLLNKKNMQQRFYIDTLASVAASFLKENTKTKEVNQTKVSQEPKSQPSNQVFKSPTHPVNSPSIAVIQPNNSLKQAISVPIENVLHTLNEQQANKTRKLLADLPKRRSRQRKPIMVVNSSHSQRPMLPKINLNQINQGASETEASGQQNIVFSGPMAAIARQIVNSSDDLNDQDKQISSTKVINEDPNQVFLQSNNSIHSSLQQNYSNLIPRILNNLIDNQTEECDKCTDDLDKSQEVGSPQNLTSMSLLELSINNADSLFGSSVIRMNGQEHKNLDSGSQVENCSISKNNTQINLNEMSNINTILNSIVSQQTSSNNSCEGSNVIRFDSKNPSCSSFNNRKSDIVVEWTDSMNDISLSGCFFADLQTNENKDIKKTVINEVSGDSFFFNMDSMMEILPTTVNRFDESSLLNSSMNTIDNIVGKSFSK